MENRFWATFGYVGRREWPSVTDPVGAMLRHLEDAWLVSDLTAETCKT